MEVGSQLQKGKILDIESLASIIRLAEITIEGKSFFQVFSEGVNRKEFHDDSARFKRNILKEFRTFVSPEGDIDYFKHPLLRDLRKEQLEIESVIRSSIANLQSDSSYSEHLQFSSHDIVNDKYVIPIKSDRYSHKLGPIIARSESGRTLYVEPRQITSLNTKRFDIILKIDKIIFDISRKFSSLLAQNISFINNVMYSFLLFDSFQARAEFATRFKLSRPQLSNEVEIQLEGFFHPLIDSPVLNDLSVLKNSKGLIISGPNTGGKTASIKAIALSHLFMQNGLFVPAHNAKLYFYENIFYFGNDQQSLPQGLSSFSAEVKNYSELFDHLGESNLIVIDEIFNSTSSEEASALALALFNEIFKSNSNTKVIVSTHHQTLKMLAHSRDEFRSCHVGFDTEKGEPTYKLIFGTPGSSMALDIFKKLAGRSKQGMSIYNNALARIDNKVLHYEKLISSISQKEQKLNELIRQNEVINRELSNQKKAGDGLILLKVNQEVEKAKKELTKVLDQAQSLLKTVAKGEINKKQLTKKSVFLEDKLSSNASTATPFTTKDTNRPNYPRPKSISLGKNYYCSTLGHSVNVLQLKGKDEAIVGKGSLRLKVKTTDLFELNTQQKKHSWTKKVTTFNSQKEAKLEYDCRGMRLDEFQSLIDTIVPDIICSHVPFVNVIHGHGNATLKTWLRKYIAQSQDLAWDQDDSGNDGQTRIILKD